MKQTPLPGRARASRGPDGVASRAAAGAAKAASENPLPQMLVPPFASVAATSESPEQSASQSQSTHLVPLLRRGRAIPRRAADG